MERSVVKKSRYWSPPVMGANHKQGPEVPEIQSIIVGLSRDLPPKRVMRSWVGARELVVWRSQSGGLNAWDNRCPHRGMRLSHGFVRGERLNCLYHGWQYDSDKGQCRHIPAHPDLNPPNTICANPAFIAESQGFMQVSLTGAPQMPELPLAMQPVRSLTFACDDAVVISALQTHAEAILDMQQDIVILRESGRTLAAAIQPLPDGQTNLHLLLDSAAGRAELTGASQWIEMIRRIAEQSANHPKDTGKGSRA